jgi:hypothetical protein
MAGEFMVGDKVNVRPSGLVQFPDLLSRDTVGKITRTGKITCDVKFNNSDLSSRVKFAIIKGWRREGDDKTSTFAFNKRDLKYPYDFDLDQYPEIKVRESSAVSGESGGYSPALKNMGYKPQAAASERVHPSLPPSLRYATTAGVRLAEGSAGGGKRRPKRRKTHRTKKRKASKKKKKTKRKKSKTRRKRR